MSGFQSLKTIKNQNNSGTPTEPFPRTPIVRRMRREEAYFILGSRATVHSQNQTPSSSSVCQFPPSQSRPLKEERYFPGKHEIERGSDWQPSLPSSVTHGHPGTYHNLPKGPWCLSHLGGWGRGEIPTCGGNQRGSSRQARGAPLF